MAGAVGGFFDSFQGFIDFRELFSFCIREIQEKLFGVRCFGFITSILDNIWFHFFGLVEEFIQLGDDLILLGKKDLLVVLYLLLSQSIPPYLAY